MNKLISRIITILMFCGVVCFNTIESSEASVIKHTERDFTPITVTDIRGRKVTITKPVKKIAYVHRGTAEILKILKVWNKVVARSGSINDEELFPNRKDIPVLGAVMSNPYEPNYELLFNLNVDLLIVEDIPMPGLDEMLTRLEGIIPVIVVKTYEPSGLIEGLEVLGKILGKEKEAQEYIVWYSDLLKKLSEKTAKLTEEQKPNIFFKHGYGTPSDIMTFSDEMSYAPFRNKIVGCINIAANLPSQGGWVPMVDQEWLITQNIDTLIIIDPIPGSFGSSIIGNSEAALAHLVKVKALPVFSESKAVKNQSVYLLGTSFVGTPRFIIGYAYMAKWFHPNIFEDFDPQKYHQEYLTKFMNVDVDLSEQGFYVYPKK